MKILVTRKIPKIGITKLQNFSDDIIINWEERNLTSEELYEKSKNVDAMLTMLANRIDSRLLKSNNNLKVVANYAVGYNNIDIEAATQYDVVVTNTPDVLTETTADLAWALIMAITRRVVESDKYTRQGLFQGWAPNLLCGSDVNGKCLGIIGAGRIGQATARRAAGFNMDLLYYSRRRKENFEAETMARSVSLQYLLKNSDIVSLHVPLTDETKYLIDSRELRIMKDSAYLINTSRGPVVNENELVQALKNNKIAGAALDVYENEPGIHPELVVLPNVVLTPHIGSATKSTRNKMAALAADSIISVLSGEKPDNIVNPQVYGKN
ncbi:MAG: D-glycerate dehydrogenase [Candidatus Marinimicrobia bacterium]|nr:D-glycerate dehydrogenase [Candidatus Neomarinimicrobiota bacterium]